MGNYTVAIAAFNKLPESDYRYTEVQSYLVNMNHNLGNRDAAISALENISIYDRQYGNAQDSINSIKDEIYQERFDKNMTLIIVTLVTVSIFVGLLFGLQLVKYLKDSGLK